MRSATRLPLAGIFVAFLRQASADETVRRPGDHPNYRFELEPHVLLGFERWHGDGAVGLGGRFGIPIVDNGFVRSINNSVAISVGVDVFLARSTRLYVPVAMQWNFYVHRNWSVFGEPGLAFVDGARTYLDPVLGLGARYYFSESVALTLRVGYPALSAGVSWFF